MKPVHCLLLFFCVLAGCTKQSPLRATADVLATIGSRQIRISDLEAEAAHRLALGQKVPPREALLDELITREAMLARALELGLAEKPEVRRRYENILLAELKERELQPRLAAVQVSPESLRAAGAKEIRRQPAQMHLAALRFALNPRTSAERRAAFAQRLVEARERAAHLAPDETGFGALAIDHSDDQSTRYRGGDLGWFDIGRTNYSLPQQVLTAGQSLSRAGDISEVIQTDHGLYLVRLIERREAGQLSAGESDSGLQQKVLVQERKRIEVEFSAEARARVRVEINSQALASVQLDNPRQMAGTETAPPAMPGR